MRNFFVLSLVVFLLISSISGLVLAQDSDVSGTLLIESWRNDDLTIWEDIIIPAFNAHYPNIEVTFAPSPPAEYNGILSSKLESGTAGDIITCRPFDNSLLQFEAGHLVSLNDLPGLENFGDAARSGWITDDGSDVFCVPAASVLHGFIYNADIFAELGLEVPTTESEFLAVLEAIKADGQYAPLVMGTADTWEAATMGYQNIGPNYWNGEEGRLALISGDVALNEDGPLAALEALSTWSPYLIDGYQAVAYPDAQNFFTLGLGAIYPAGSWEITGFNANADFEMGVFKPPVPDGQETCYVSDHVDMGFGLNAASENQEVGLIFLEWTTSAEFADLFGNQLPGFFPLGNHDISLDDPLANEFLSWRGECETTIRSSYQILSRGEPNLENELWRVSALLLNGELTSQEAGDVLQEGLASWYEPQMGG